MPVKKAKTVIKHSVKKTKAVKPSVKKVAKVVKKVTKVTRQPALKKVVKPVAKKISTAKKTVIKKVTAKKAVIKKATKDTKKVTPKAKKAVVKKPVVKAVKAVKTIKAALKPTKKVVKTRSKAKVATLRKPVSQVVRPLAKGKKSDELVNTKESAIGLVIMGVAIFAIALTNVLALNHFSKANACNLPEATISAAAPVVETQTANVITATATPTATPVVTPSPRPTVQVASVQPLTADTENPTYTVTVQKVDNFWKIAERTCGNGKYGEQLRRQTGYTNRSIQPGDVLRVQCP